MHRVLKGLLASGAFAATFALGAPAHAAPAAVDLVFYAPFFAKSANGSTLTYSFVRKAEDKKLEPSFEDEIRVKVGPQGAENSVTIDLFSGERSYKLDNMSRTGNPLIVAVFEREVKEMQKATGGSPYYLRNRIMEAIREGATEPAKIEFNGKSLDGWKVVVKPFEKDSHRAQLREWADATYELTFSDDVPGGLHSFKGVAPRPSGAAPLVSEEVVLKAEAAAAADRPEEKKP